MMSDSVIEFTLPDADATDALGKALAAAFLRVREADIDGSVLHLRGDLGAGKTTCARSLLRTFGVTGLIRSPTYTLVETYDLGPWTCAHVDLYRLAGATSVDEIGLRDLPGRGGLLLIEWPEKGTGAVPPADLELRLDYAPVGRTARASARNTHGRAWLDNLHIDTR